MLFLVAYVAWRVLTFTAPADSVPGAAGRFMVARYELVMAASPSLASSTTQPFYSRPNDTSPTLAPAAPGTKQAGAVAFPGDMRPRYLALYSYDDAGNKSLVSNLAAAIGAPQTYFPDSVRDDFAGFDGSPLGAPWTGQLGPAQIQGGRLRVDDYADLFWDGRTFGPRQFARLTYGRSDRQACLTLKIQGNGSRIELDYEPTGLHLNLLTDGVWSSLGTYPLGLAQGDVLYARCDQNGNVEAWKNGALILQRSLAWKYATLGGRTGVSLWGNALVDDFGAGTW